MTPNELKLIENLQQHYSYSRSKNLTGFDGSGILFSKNGEISQPFSWEKGNTKEFESIISHYDFRYGLKISQIPFSLEQLLRIRKLIENHGSNTCVSLYKYYDITISDPGTVFLYFIDKQDATLIKLLLDAESDLTAEEHNFENNDK